MTSARYAVRTLDLTKTYGRGPTAVTALDAVSVELDAGAFTAIMGPSGSGKSTLMHVAAGLDDATGGRSWIGDTEITALGDDDLTRLRRDRVGFVFQAFNLMPTLDARANILLPVKLAGRRPDAGWFDQVVSVLGLGDRLDHRPAELSGGQQQRVAIARALVARPDVIFADEPTGALDSASGHAILDFLARSVRELGQTVVMVTHDAAAAGYADRVLTLGDGRVVGDDIRRRPTPPAQTTPKLETPARGAQVDGTQAHGTQAHGTQAHGTQAHGTQAHGTQAHGTQAHGTQAGGMQVDGTPGAPAPNTSGTTWADARIEA